MWSTMNMVDYSNTFKKSVIISFIMIVLQDLFSQDKEGWTIMSKSNTKSKLYTSVSKYIKLFIENMSLWSHQGWNHPTPFTFNDYQVSHWYSTTCLYNSSIFNPLQARMSNADDRSKISIVLKKFQNSIFGCHIWIQHEKCIWLSTNKPSIGSVVL